MNHVAAVIDTGNLRAAGRIVEIASVDVIDNIIVNQQV